MRWFGVILRNSGLNWSPAPILTGMMLYSSPNSSSAICTFWPFGVGQDQTSSIGLSPLSNRTSWSGCLTINQPVIISRRVGGRTMGCQVNIAEAKAKLSELLDRALGGEEIVIARAGKPLA